MCCWRFTGRPRETERGAVGGGWRRSNGTTGAGAKGEGEEKLLRDAVETIRLSVESFCNAPPLNRGSGNDSVRRSEMKKKRKKKEKKGGMKNSKDGAAAAVLVERSLRTEHDTPRGVNCDPGERPTREVEKSSTAGPSKEN